MRRSSTQVLFPRFQAEVPGEREFDTSGSRERTFLRGWLSREDACILITPVPENIAETKKPREAKGRWWGVYHKIQEIVTVEQIFDSPFDSGANAYRSRILTHSYLWDEQALSGTSHEVVLQKHLDSGFWCDEAAILFSAASWVGSPDYGKQRLVVREDGDWVEPEFKFWVTGARHDDLLVMMSELSQPTSPPK